MDTNAEGFTKMMLVLYDVATEVATKEGKSHREAFDLVCQYLELQLSIEEKEKTIAEKEKNIAELEGKIKEGLGTLAILTAIQQGKIGQG